MEVGAQTRLGKGSTARGKREEKGRDRKRVTQLAREFPSRCLWQLGLPTALKNWVRLCNAGMGLKSLPFPSQKP